MLPLIIQLISGAVGGNVAGALMKNLNLGPILATRLPDLSAVDLAVSC